MAIDIGIETKARKKIVGALEQVLGDTYGLYLKTHGYHWNVEGPMFNTLHLMFEAQYNDLWLSMDLIAERIRSLGEYAPLGEQIGAKSQLTPDKSRARRREDDRQPGERQRDAGALGARRAQGRRGSRRPGDGRPDDPARRCRGEDGVDAAVDGGEVGLLDHD